jgi:phage portal protein BeeE
MSGARCCRVIWRCRGNAYNRIVANGRGEIVELVPIHPDRIRMELTPSGDYRYRVTDRLGVEAICRAGRSGICVACRRTV